MEVGLIEDRYPLTLDCRAFVERLANTYAEGTFWNVRKPIRYKFQRQALAAFGRIPVPVMFTKDNVEPYATQEEMARRIAAEGVFIVRWREPSCHPLGAAHSLFRAAHDWFGHIVARQPFNMEGELAAFQVHAASTMFSSDTLPLVWSEVVLENSYRLYHGQWLKPWKLVYDPRWGWEGWHQ